MPVRLLACALERRAATCNALVHIVRLAVLFDLLDFLNRVQRDPAYTKSTRTSALIGAFSLAYLEAPCCLFTRLWPVEMRAVDLSISTASAMSFGVHFDCSVSVSRGEGGPTATEMVMASARDASSQTMRCLASAVRGAADEYRSGLLENTIGSFLPFPAAAGRKSGTDSVGSQADGLFPLKRACRPHSPVSVG